MIISLIVFDMRKLKSFSMIESLSIQQARKLVLQSQRLPATKQSGSALSSTLFALEHLGYVQIDTISAIQRAHHHTLWNRNPRYENSHIDQLLEEKQIFENIYELQFAKLNLDKDIQLNNEELVNLKKRIR